MEFYYQVQIERVLEGVVEFGDLWIVRQSYNVSFFFKEGDLRKM